MGSMDSWLYDPQALYSVTLTGQFFLLKLIEEFELNGIKVISSNSDGVTTYFHKDKLEIKNKIIKEWQKLTNIEIETVSFKKFYYSTVNDYLAITSDGKVKLKGDFLSDFELYKNPSMKVIPLAIQDHLINNTNPIEFITNHKEIYDFCIRAKVGGDFYIEERCPKGECEIKHGKMLRYYVSNEGNELFKKGFDKNGDESNAYINAPIKEMNNKHIYSVNFNTFVKKDIKDYDIDYSFYIYKTLRLIDNIKNTNYLKSYLSTLNSHKQISLF